jgi:hypothetical protein
MSDGMERHFVWHSQAWYHNAAPLAFGDTDEVSFGQDGSEMIVGWVELGGRAVPCLRVFDDSWGALSDMPDVLAAMALQDNNNIGPTAFCYMLKSLGFVDETPRESPYKRQDDTQARTIIKKAVDAVRTMGYTDEQIEEMLKP